jgi:recombinational DNA repair protein (RecF pathway)
MHSIYNTDAYVLDEKMSGEAGKNFFLFTKDLGFIYASAQGIRYQKSKLKFALQKYSRAKVSLVSGKTGWKIVNAIPEDNLLSILGNGESFYLIVRIFSLLNRLVQGEEINVDIFNIIENAIAFLEQNNFDKEKLRDIECVLVLRILNNLGYVGDNEELKFFVLDNEFKNEHIEEINKRRSIALGEINRALRESQL